MNLYWVKTKGSFEDWFIVAPTKEIACDCHEGFEGFDEGDAKAEFVCEIPDNIEKKHKAEYDAINGGYWPSHELLVDLGFEFIDDISPRIVRGHGRLFKEGGSTLALTIKHLDKKQGVYFINMRDTSKFKIGITRKISRRLKEIKTANPFVIDLWYFIECENPRKVERLFHELFKDKIISGEWYQLKTFKEIFSAMEVVEQKNEIKIHNILKVIENL
ncbi:GIY-YIG nuclease family protein [Prolixibacter sp. NT017]|uniref:GIY-YIG nuclease family protein n=1 Tax=Prolixibacter sp. NT017 TaxID=2652390 RepID=UPI00126CF774|nr:GIY-YIG nuclease family protein [Prolixibacter sp. NT017]GET24279.1 hypothetical protein NT017_06080 [Prolixibacter sp. NT017]